MRTCNSPSSIDPSDIFYFLPLKDIYLGADVKNLINKPEICKNEMMVQDICQRCRKFLITSCQQIQMRFDFNNPILQSMNLLQSKIIFSNKRPNSLLPFIQMFPRVVNQLNTSVQDIDDGWRRFSIIDLQQISLKLLNVEEFWIKLKLYENNEEYPFKIITQFILVVLSLPQSNVSCKRMFSKINFIKTKQRSNRLQTLSLNILLNASQCMKETSCHKFEPSSIT